MVLVWNVLETYFKERGLETGEGKVKTADGLNFKVFFDKAWIICSLFFEISSRCFFLISGTGDSGSILVSSALVIKCSVTSFEILADQL